MSLGAPNPDAAARPPTPIHPALGLLGHWRLSGVRDGDTVVGHARRLLAVLALRGAMTRAEIRGTLWPALDEREAASRLRTALWRMARLRGVLIQEERGLLRLAPEVRVDVSEMLLAASSVGSGRTAEAPGRFAADLLPGWDEDWLVVDRERVRQTRLHALEQLSGSLLAQGDYGPALDAALTCLDADPLRESAHRAVIRVHLAEGNLAAALAQYHRCAGILREELGLQPTRRLTELLAGAGARVP